ncbi:MAG TPA: sulfurtransferase TusA family protein [Geobacteraceae bacterium]
MKLMEFDIRGQICPSTLLIALKEMNLHRDALRSGEVQLAFKTDNRDATITIPDAAANMGYGVSVEKEEGYYVIVIEAGQ